MSIRLGMTLSDHRIIEVFTSVKSNLGNLSTDLELNDKEFELALNYIQKKSIFMTLEMIGITEELLGLLFIWLVILLLLIFSFILVGIKAFAIGGTFGSVVNSFFPIGLIII